MHPFLKILLGLCLIPGLRLTSAESLGIRVLAKTSGFAGHVTLFAKNLDTGATFELSPDEPVRTASTIKLPIMIECFHEAQEGKLRWSEPITLLPGEKVNGSGVLTELSDNVQLPLRDLMHLMIVVSDNTATNLILNRITGNAVNHRMELLGLKETRIMRKILGDQPTGITEEGSKPENKKWGLGRSSPREMVVLLEKLYKGQLVSPEASKEMLAVLKRQQSHEGIGRDLKDMTIASKSGALDHLRSDLGIVYTKKGAIAMAITIDNMPEVIWSSDNPGDLLISSLSGILIEGLGGQ